ncbi:Uncharacterized protein Y057_7584 [Fusarium fujikuroi]|nr:Uncharacterized protein Y057_7584 [Fusarium fujikuroi]
MSVKPGKPPRSRRTWARQACGMRFMAVKLTLTHVLNTDPIEQSCLRPQRRLDICCAQRNQPRLESVIDGSPERKRTALTSNPTAHEHHSRPSELSSVPPAAAITSDVQDTRHARRQQEDNASLDLRRERNRKRTLKEKSAIINAIARVKRKDHTVNRRYDIWPRYPEHHARCDSDERPTPAISPFIHSRAVLRVNENPPSHKGLTCPPQDGIEPSNLLSPRTNDDFLDSDEVQSTSGRREVSHTATQYHIQRSVKLKVGLALPQTSTFHPMTCLTKQGKVRQSEILRSRRSSVLTNGSVEVEIPHLVHPMSKRSLRGEFPARCEQGHCPLQRPMDLPFHSFEDIPYRSTPCGRDFSNEILFRCGGSARLSTRHPIAIHGAMVTVASVLQLTGSSQDAHVSARSRIDELRADGEMIQYRPLSLGLHFGRPTRRKGNERVQFGLRLRCDGIRRPRFRKVQSHKPAATSQTAPCRRRRPTHSSRDTWISISSWYPQQTLSDQMELDDLEYDDASHKNQAVKYLSITNRFCLHRNNSFFSLKHRNVSPLNCERLGSSPNTTTGGTQWFKEEQRPAFRNLALPLLIFRLFLRFTDRFVSVSNGSAAWRLVPEIPGSSFSDLTSAHLLNSASLCVYLLVHHPSEVPMLPGRWGRCRLSLVVVPVDCSEAHRTSSSSLNH